MCLSWLLAIGCCMRGQRDAGLVTDEDGPGRRWYGGWLEVGPYLLTKCAKLLLTRDSGPGERFAMSNKAAILETLAQMNERPEAAARSLREYQKSARVLSSNQPRLIDEYPDQWVAVSDSNVIANGANLKNVLQQVDRKGFNRSDILIRFIERTQRTLIL